LNRTFGIFAPFFKLTAKNFKNIMQAQMVDQNLKYKVKDINLAKWGRLEIELAEAEMPGLMALRAQYNPPNH
jgi:hypothetical protein